MSAVRPRDTKPEKIVRSLLTALGLRYRVNCFDLPGRPDIVFPRRRKVILVHGCFWHRHPGCSRTTTPRRNNQLWQNKFSRTLERDAHNAEALAAAGWDVLVVWECQTTDRDALTRLLRLFLNGE